MLKVRINQRLCIGNGACSDIAPDVFVLGDDDLAFLHDDGRVLAGDASMIVPRRLDLAVLEACDQCPAGCIDIEAVS